jgi:hypothetical protein
MKKSLSDILAAGSDRDQLSKQWAEVKAADDFGKALPRGEYIARIEKGELFQAKVKGTPGYKLTIRVIEGEYTGRKFWLDIWLTEANLPNAKRDLGKLGVTSLDQLESPLPQGIRCRVMLVVRKDDDGTDRNEVRFFEVVGVDSPEPNPFAPGPETDKQIGDETEEAT